MVDTVVLAGQHQVAVLQQSDPSWQAEVGVRPLVDLISHGHKDGKSKHKTVPGVGLGKGVCNGYAEGADV